MSLLDWLTDGTLTGGLTNNSADMGGTTPNTGMPGQPPVAPMAPPPVQQIGADAPPLPPTPTPVSELLRGGLIVPTAERRKNKSGMLARCWRAVVTGAFLDERTP